MKGGHDIGNEPGGLRGRLQFLADPQDYLHILEVVRSGGCSRVRASAGSAARTDGRRVRDMSYSAVTTVVVRDEISREKCWRVLALSDNVTVMRRISDFLTDPEPSGIARSLGAGDRQTGRRHGRQLAVWRAGAAPRGETVMERYSTAAHFRRALERTYKDLAAAPVFVLQDMTTFHGIERYSGHPTMCANRLRRRDVPVRMSSIKTSSPSDVGWIFTSRCELVIGTRFHSCVLAAAAGTPAIAIEYQGTKTRGLVAQPRSGRAMSTS